jgi:hypothetical protein
MLAALLHSIWQYQVFKSVVFRGGMAFLTAYLLIVWGDAEGDTILQKKGNYLRFYHRASRHKTLHRGASNHGRWRFDYGNSFWCSTLV